MKEMVSLQCTRSQIGAEKKIDDKDNSLSVERVPEKTRWRFGEGESRRWL